MTSSWSDLNVTNVIALVGIEAGGQNLMPKVGGAVWFWPYGPGANKRNEESRI